MKFLTSILLVLVFVSCSKSSGTTPPPPPADEENLVIALDPDPAGSLVKALSTTYTFNLVIKSKMPPQGVTVNVVVKKDSDNSVVFSQSLSTTTTPLSITLQNLPLNEICTCTIDVISKTKSSNTASTSFKIAKK